jgi:RNA polymerase sigma factor (sigma-70 family)
VTTQGRAEGGGPAMTESQAAVPTGHGRGEPGQAGREANANVPSREYQFKMTRPGPLGRRRGSASDSGVDEFIGLFWCHGSAVHSYLSRRVGHQQADDLLEEVWVRAFRSRDRYDDRLPPRAWLYGIARHVLLGYFRSQHSIPARDTVRHNLGEPDPWDAVDDRLEARRSVSGLSSALAALADEDREVLLLVAWEQLTPAEAAVVLDIPQGTARSRLHRARAQLRGYLETSESPPRPYPSSSLHSAEDPALEGCDD